MSKFNTKQTVANRATTYEGAVTYTKSLEQDWMNNLFSSFLQDQFYESAEDQQIRYLELTAKMAEKYGYPFVAKAAKFSRNELGMRSISQITMAYLNDKLYEGKRQDFAGYFHRPDDISEVFGAIDSIGGKRSHALIRGAADYLSKCNEYQLAKYAMPGKTYNMFDLINITHAHSDAIDKYKAGEVDAPDTWEHNIMVAEDDESRQKAWRELVEGNKMGYLALLRNLRNILSCDFATYEWIDKYLAPQLTNEKKIKKSLVFPYQIYTAYKNLKMPNVSIIAALDTAFRVAIGNVPNMNGKSLVVLDVSGSMESYISARSTMTMKEVGAVYGAMIYLANKGSAFIKFGNYAKRRDYSRNVNVFDLIRDMQSNDQCGYGTDIGPVWRILDDHYDRIFLISDMQVMASSRYGYGTSYRETPVNAMHRYFAKWGTSHIYSFDLSNYRTSVENPDSGHITMLTALNDQLFKMLDYLESGGKSLVNYINENY